MSSLNEKYYQLDYDTGKTYYKKKVLQKVPAFPAVGVITPKNAKKVPAKFLQSSCKVPAKLLQLLRLIVLIGGIDHKKNIAPEKEMNLECILKRQKNRNFTCEGSAHQLFPLKLGEKTEE